MGTSNKPGGWLAIVALLLMAVACAPNDTYDKIQPIEEYKWHRADSLHYEVAVDDTNAVYDLYLTFRHNDDYPFTNLWFKLITHYPNGDTGRLRKHMKVADNEKLAWKGECMHNVCSVKFPIVQDLYLSHAGKYRFTVAHVMRTDPLPGVMDVGLHLKKQPLHKIDRRDTMDSPSKDDNQPKPVNLPPGR